MPVSTGQTIIATTWLGDANLDGIVNGDDYGFWSNTVSSNPKSYIYGGAKPEWVDGDFNYDGRVDSDDYGFWSNTMTTPGANYDLGFTPQFGPVVSQQVATASSAAEDLTVGQGWNGSSVPEPGSFVMLTLAVIGLAPYRGKRGKQCVIAGCLAVAAFWPCRKQPRRRCISTPWWTPPRPAAANVSNNGYTYAVNAADYNTTVTLDVYGLIKDASPSQRPTG